MKARVVLKGLALMLSLALLGYLFKSSDLGSSVNQAWIDARVRGHGLHGAALFLLVGTLFTAVGLPRQLIAFLGGYGFNIVLGTALATVATMLGCMLAFAYARFFGKDLLRNRLGELARRFDGFMREHPLSMTVLIRLLPVGSNLATNLIAGVSSIRAVPFLVGSLVGYLPQTLAFVLVGSGVHIAQGLKLSLAAALFLVSGALGVWLTRRFMQSRALDGAREVPTDLTL